MKRKGPVKVRVWVTEIKSAPQPLRASWGTPLLMATIIGAVGVVIGGSWLAVRLILNPASLAWLGHLLPTWDIAAAPPQTLQQIQAQVDQTGHQISQPIHLSTYPGLMQQQLGFHDVLLPVVKPLKYCTLPQGQMRNQPALAQGTFAQRTLEQTCHQIVELRIYRPTPRHASTATTYELVDQIAVTGPEELTAIAPLSQVSQITQGSTRTLPLTHIQFIPGAAPAGIWWHLSGEWKRGSRVLYGQVIQFDPQSGRLYSVQAWSSPAGQLPRWQQVTGDKIAELVVDQSIGLEPQFQVYQLKPSRSLAQSVTLEAITLTEAALPDRSYTHGLLMARHGLWSPAVQLLTTVKRTGNWSPTAQAQLDLVQLHAKVTQTQADRDWASPTQQILSQIMDGRWSKALGLLKAAHRSGYDVENLLVTNAERLWQRIETALRINPRQGDLQEWGLLLQAVRQDQAQAIAWLRRQPIASPAARPSIEETLALLQPVPSAHPQLASGSTDAAAVSVSTPAAAPVAANHPSGNSLIGAVTPLTDLQVTDWVSLTPTPLTLAPLERWYRVDVISLDHRPPLPSGLAVSSAAATQQAQQLWQQLGFPDPQLQLMAWQGATAADPLSATVKAIQLNQGQLSLLVAGASFPSPLNAATILAMTPHTLSWSQPSVTLTLAELAQQQPFWQTTLIPQLWQDLQAAELIPAAAKANDPLQTIGGWSVQLMELTGDQPPEIMLTIAPADARSPRTAIFSAQGMVLYRDWQTTDRSLVAIADRANHDLPTLVVIDAQGLGLQQWSRQTQRFESYGNGWKD